MGAGMSAPAGTEVTQQSFIGRVCSSMCGMVIGIFLILGCMAFTGWNEGNFVCRAKVISHADEVMVRVPCNATSAAHAAGSLLFFSGCPLTNQKVFDNAPDAAASSLSSEMLAYCMFKCAPRVHPRHRHPYGCKVHMTRLRRLHGLPAPHGTTSKDLMTSLRRLHGLPVPHGTTPKDLILAPLRRPLHRLLRPRRPRRPSGRRVHLRSCATARRSRPAVDYRSPVRPARRRRRRRPVP